MHVRIVVVSAARAVVEVLGRGGGGCDVLDADLLRSEEAEELLMTLGSDRDYYVLHADLLRSEEADELLMT